MIFRKLFRYLWVARGYLLNSSSSFGMRYFSLILPAVCSDDKLKKLEISLPNELSHNFLLKQASSITANSASQLLSCTISALVDTAEEYKKALADAISVIESSKDNLGNELLQQELSDIIVEYRSKVNLYKTQFLELETFFDYVEKVIVSTSETNFLAGAEYSAFSLSERLHAAKLELSRLKKTIESKEVDYLRTQQSYIEKSTKFEEDTTSAKD